MLRRGQLEEFIKRLGRIDAHDELLQLFALILAYDIAADSWTTLASIPQALWVAGFGIIDGKLYVAGGSDLITQLNTLYIYNIASNRWTTGANVPAAAEAPGSAVLNGKLYLFGGFPTLLAITQIYDPDSNTWSAGPNMNTYEIWRFLGTAVGNDSIVAIGGQSFCGSALDNNEQLVTIRCPTPRPTPRPHPTPRPRP